MRIIMTGVKSTVRQASILSLPLVPRSSRLTERLLPDSLTPTPASLLSVPGSSPSLLRRSRHVGEGAHFSYVTPLVLEFPYDLKKVEGSEAEEEEQQSEEQLEDERKKVEKMSEEERSAYGLERARKEMDRVEALMRPYEIEPQPSSSFSHDRLTGFLPKARRDRSYPSARLLGLSKECIDDCLPQLDVGDALEWIRSRSGKDGPDCYSSGPMAEVSSTANSDGQASARTELSDFLSGRLIGAQLPSSSDLQDVDVSAEPGVGQAQHRRVVDRGGGADQESKEQRWSRRGTVLRKRQSDYAAAYRGYAPWANAYSGHQFGQWAGQLGDGRAVTLMETFNGNTGQRCEIQLKGAGRTPYSRFADGLAALFSSVREYLASEAMHGLGIPTSRALALLSVKEVVVMRESRHPAAVCARLAPIWTRVGSFEHHATRKEWESVRLLGQFTCREGYGWMEVEEGGKPWAERLIRECARRNAEMIAQWQAYGFMHGVMNTDNISLLGITIDYGPYGFMDIFDRHTICNKSDGEGRYAFHMQPTAAMFVMEKLTSSLAAVAGFERKNGRAARAGELVGLEDDTMSEFGRETHELLWPTIKEYFMDTLIVTWTQAWRKRFGLNTSDDADRADLIDPLFDILEGYLDFTHSLRRLHTLPSFISYSGGDDEKVEEFVSQWLDWDRVPSFVKEQKRADAVSWTKRYVERLRKDRQSFDSLSDDLKAVNPTFTLRNWVTDEVNERLRTKDDTDFLSRILHMSLHPFKDWGEDGTAKSPDQLAEEKRLCAVGTLLTTNMPSCSS